jgi:hypothetical protein
MINRAVSHPIGAVVVSVVLGLGLAALFKRTCVDGRCIIVRGPNVHETALHTYRLGEDCYRYTARPSPCQTAAVP